MLSAAQKEKNDATTKDGILYTDKNGNAIHDLVHRTPPKTGDSDVR